MRIFIILLITALALPTVTADLDIKGIPEPEFGIDERAPNTPNLDTEVPGFYYIHRQHAQATDENNAYGTTSKPRMTIPEDLPAGSVVEIKGTYDYSPFGYSRITGHGTENQPIFISGDRITRTIQVKGNYIIIENLDFNDEDGNLNSGDTGKIVVTGPAHHVVIRNNEVTGNRNAGGIHVGSFTDDDVEDVVVYDNKVHDNGDWRASFDQDVHGIHVGHRANHVWIVENELYHNSGDGLQISAGNRNLQSTTHHIYVGKNVAHDNKQSGLWTKQAVDVIFSENHVYSHEPSDSSPGACIGYQYAPERVWFLFNHVHDCTYGIGSGSDSGQGDGRAIFMIGNRIHDIHGQQIDAWSSAGIQIAGGEEVQVVGNIISDVDAGINIPSTNEYYISSNAISTSGNHIYIDDVNGQTDWQIKNNVFDGERIKIRNQVYTVQQLQQTFGAAGNVAGDPRIGDDGLLSSSPLFSIAENLDVLDDFEDLYDVRIELFADQNDNDDDDNDDEDNDNNDDDNDNNDDRDNDDDEDDEDSDDNDNDDDDNEEDESDDDQVSNSQTVSSSNGGTSLPRLDRSSGNDFDDVAFDRDVYYYEPDAALVREQTDNGVSVYIIPASDAVQTEESSNPLKWMFPSFVAMDMMAILLVGMVVRQPRAPKRLSGTRVRSVHTSKNGVKVKLE